MTVSLCWLLGQTESPPPRPKALYSWYITWLSISNGYRANQAHSQYREMDWPYLHMNQWVGHTLIATEGADPVPLTQPSSLFPSSQKVLLPPHNPSPFSLQDPPSQPHGNYHPCTGGESTRATRARPSHVLVALHGMGEARGVFCCVFQRIPLLSSLLYQRKQFLLVLGPRANPERLHLGPGRRIMVPSNNGRCWPSTEVSLPPWHHQKAHEGSKMPPDSRLAQLAKATKHKTGSLAGVKRDATMCGKWHLERRYHFFSC